MSDLLEPLMTPADLAKFMGLAEGTIRTLLSREPEKLPPRCSKISKPRWVPSVVKQWAEQNSGAAKRKVGRPRAAV